MLSLTLCVKQGGRMGYFRNQKPSAVSVSERKVCYKDMSSLWFPPCNTKNLHKLSGKTKNGLMFANRIMYTFCLLILLMHCLPRKSIYRNDHHHL